MYYKKLAELLFPNVDKTPEYFEERYPKRNVSKDTCITRIGPSPTGFVHLGNLYNAIIGERIAHQSGGTIFLRIEDTDSKRKVEGATETIIKTMEYFGIKFDEGVTLSGENGVYAPYQQSHRKDIYQAFAKRLVEMGHAYPCFCKENELSVMHQSQAFVKDNFGYYGKYAVWRSRPLEEIEEKLVAGEPYVLRFRSLGDSNNYITIMDGIRGELNLQENYQDFVLLKSDGVPTYHFAHVVDDHLMRTTHVIRGEEWISTLSMHIQLFDTFGWDKPIYCHTPQLMKIDEEDGISKKRKLSKRKDPELALAYYVSEGYLPEAVWVYLLTILNSNFEEWYHANPNKSYLEFPFSLSNMSSSGALLDIPKFRDISRDIISRLSADSIYDSLVKWSMTYDTKFYKAFTNDSEYSKKAIDIGRNDKNPRKDLENWKQASKFLSFYFDDTFNIEDRFPENAQGSDKNTILRKYLETLNFNDTQEQWFEKIRDIARELNYAVRVKDYKKNPEQYKGSIVDVSNVIRIAITGRCNSPDIYEISHIMGCDRVIKRIQNSIKGA